VGSHSAGSINPSFGWIGKTETVTFFINDSYLGTTLTFIYNRVATSTIKRTAVRFHQKAFISFSYSLAYHVLESSMEYFNFARVPTGRGENCQVKKGLRRCRIKGGFSIKREKSGMDQVVK